MGASVNVVLFFFSPGLRREKKASQAKCKLKEQAEYCNTIGMLLFEARRLDEALEEHREELTLCQTLSDSIGECVIIIHCPPRGLLVAMLS